MDVISASTIAAAYEASLTPIGSVSNLRNLVGDPLLSWSTAPVPAAMECGHSPMVSLSKWLRLYTPGSPFLPRHSAHSLLSPPGLPVMSTSETFHVDLVFPTWPGLSCFEFAATPADVTCTQDALPKFLVELRM